MDASEKLLWLIRQNFCGTAKNSISLDCAFIHWLLYQKLEFELLQVFLVYLYSFRQVWLLVRSVFLNSRYSGSNSLTFAIFKSYRMILLISTNNIIMPFSGLVFYFYGELSHIVNHKLYLYSMLFLLSRKSTSSSSS